MHCNLRPPAVLRINYDAYAKAEIVQYITSQLISFLLRITYIAL